MTKKILVVGGAGYIGSACVAALLKQGHRVTVLDDLSTGQREQVLAEADLVTGDITNPGDVRAVFDAAHIDAVLHFAAKKAVGESETDPSLYFHTNVVGSYNLLSAMEQYRVPQLIFSSTAAVYEPPHDGLLVTEETPLAPVNVYGKTKQMVEDMILSYARVGVLDSYTILRYFNVAGDAGLSYRERDAQNVFPLLAQAAREDTSFHIFGTDYPTPDGTCVRDYIHLADLVDAHVRALSGPNGIYNLGTGTGYSVRELIASCNDALPKPLQVIEGERRAGDPAILVADATRAHEALGWQPKHSLADITRSTLRTYDLI